MELCNEFMEVFMDLITHSNNVMHLCLSMAKILKFSYMDYFHMSLCAKFHDIGKYYIPDYILDKKDKLSDYEYEIVKAHCIFGAAILKRYGYDISITYPVLCHHERYDGLGYMIGLKGEQIPLYSRIISIADSFDAMTNIRPYSKPISALDALDEIERCSGSQFDPLLAEIFVNMLRVSANTISHTSSFLHGGYA